MSFRERMHHLFCPTCIHEEHGQMRRENTVRILERSSAALDRIAKEMRGATRRMADDNNPLLGDPPERDRS